MERGIGWEVTMDGRRVLAKNDLDGLGRSKP
jgi:hypothetical protein